VHASEHVWQVGGVGKYIAIRHLKKIVQKSLKKVRKKVQKNYFRNVHKGGRWGGG
jgi:hypothetical protein